jgi:acetolactate synthase small subunit
MWLFVVDMLRMLVMSSVAEATPSGGLFNQTQVYCFALMAQALPGVMPRVMEPFAKRGLVPARCHATVCGRTSSELSIDVQIADIDADQAELIAAQLRQIVGVSTVLTSEKRQIRAG